MNILNSLIQLRDDLKSWVTNNINAINAKIDEKTIPIDNKLDTASKNPVQNKVVTNAINNIPKFSGDYNDLINTPNIEEDDSGNMIIADESGNIIFKTDAEGTHTTALYLNGKTAATEEYVDNAIDNIDIPTIDIPEVDLTGYATEEHVTSAIETVKEELGESIIAEDSDFKITDNSGNIIFRVDEGGTHTTSLTLDGKATATEEYVDNAISNIDITDVDLTGYATETYVDNKVADLVNSAPEALNTLGKLATALENHEDAYDALLETVGSKATYTDLENLKDEISESIVSETDEWKVVDNSGNIIFSIDADGAHTTSLTLNGESVEDIIDDKVASLAGAGESGAAVVCNFVGYEGDETGETDTAAWNAAMQELEETGKKILILQGANGNINIENITLENLIIIGYNSGIDTSWYALNYSMSMYSSIVFKKCQIFGGSYIAEGTVGFENSEIHDINFESAWVESNYASGTLKMINCYTSWIDFTLLDATQVEIKNCSLPTLYIGKNSKYTHITLIDNDINDLMFHNYESQDFTIGSIYLKGNDNLYGIRVYDLWGANCTVKSFTAIDNIGGNGYQDLFTGCTIGGTDEWGSYVGTVTFEKVTLAHNMDTNKVLYDVKSQSGSQETFDTFSLEASKWTDNLYYFSNFETTTDEYIPSKVDLEVSLNGTFATKEQKEAFDKAELVGTQDNHIRAYGEVPTIDIPILLKVVHK